MKKYWKSVHLFIWDYSLFDYAIKKIYINFKAHGIDDLFFIRYWEGSPHIRVRVRETVSDEIINEVMYTTLDEIKKEFPEIIDAKLDKIDFYKTSFLDGKNLDINELPWYENLSFIRMTYEREIDRYGGEDLISITEDCFVISSQLIYQVLSVNDNISYKNIVFIKFLKSILDNILKTNKDKLELLKMASDFWLKNGIYEAIDLEKYQKLFDFSESVSMDDTFDLLINKMSFIYQKVLTDNYYYAISIIFSHIHMFANRIGISMGVELSAYNFFKRYYK